MRFLSKFINYLSIALFFFLLVFIVSYFYKSNLPDPKVALPELKNDPFQTPTTTPKFTVKNLDIDYEITPLYTYELYGMIVSSGDNLSWFSRFKDRDPLNINDFCVIWGSNVDNGIYKVMKFWNQEFQCQIKYNGDNKDFSKFSNNHLSNNHFLVDELINPELYAKIRLAQTGDQIHFKGYLVSYSVSKAGVASGSRGSSTTREDAGDGACETVYITDFEILKKHNPEVPMINNLSKNILFYGAIVWFIVYILLLVIPNQYQRENEPLISKTKNFQDSLPTNITEGKIE